jgi:Tol biopolymer transport system component
LPKLLTLLLLTAILCSCFPSTQGSGDSSGTACGPSEAAPLLPGRLLITGNATLELWSSGRRTLIACVHNTPQYFTHPAFAPDGKSIAYVLSNAPTAGGQDWGDDIYKANAGSTDTRLVHPHEAPGTQIDSLAWTPDGRDLIAGSFRIVYDAEGRTASTTYEVDRIDPSTGASTELLQNAGQASVSPDGRHLSYVSYPSADLNASQLAISDIDGANPHLILIGQPGFQSYFAPHLSPDGKKIVFAAIGGPLSGSVPRHSSWFDRLASLFHGGWMDSASADGSPYELWVATIDGGDMHPLANLREDLPFPQWSSDGSQILFLGAAALYLASADGSSIKQIDKGVAHGQIDWYQR